MENKKTSIFENGLIWFGAAVSIAEIATGTYIAPLGFKNGLIAILLGHLIGCAVLYLAGLIGAKSEKSAMDTVKFSFGQKGSVLFSTLNILQLIGWTAIMIIIGSASADLILNIGGTWLWSVIIGAFIIVWVMIGIKNLNKLNLVAMGGLFILTLILSATVFKNPIMPEASGGMTFGAAVELSAAMPLSWLPLISDYTRFGRRKNATALTSAVVYFFASSWMYVIGLGAALFLLSSDVAEIMLKAGLGIAGLLIVIFSTVTTTFLDVFSAGVSAVSIWNRFGEKRMAMIICVIGTILAIVIPMTQYENFLYFIGSVFAPMISILIVDYFILKSDKSNTTINIKNIILWAAGFVIYRLFMRIDTPVGNTLPVMIITGLICYLVNLLTKIGGNKSAGYNP